MEQVFSLTGEDRFLGVLPFFHSFGFTGTLCLPAVLGVGTVYHVNPLDAKTIGPLVHDHQATFLLATPTFLQLYLRGCTPEQFALINLAEANPGTVEYQRMVGDFYLQINNIDDAIIIYNKILINFPNDGFSHVGLAECYRKKGDIEKSFIEIKIAFKSEEIPSDVKFNMLLSLIQNAGENAEIQKAAYDLTEILVKMYQGYRLATLQHARPP
jgi:tetratricopeptide (TPR) repeat protein